MFFYTTRFEIDDIANLERSSATQRIPVHGTQEKKHVPRCARDDSFILIFCFFVLMVCLVRDLMRELRLGLM